MYFLSARRIHLILRFSYSSITILSFIFYRLQKQINFNWFSKIKPPASPNLRAVTSKWTHSVPPECCAMCRIRRQTLRHRMQWLACSRRIYAVVMPRRQRGSKKFLTPARGLWVLARFGGSCGRGDPRRCSGSASTRRRTSSDLDFCTASGGFGPMPRSNSTRCRVTNKPRSSQSEMVGVHSMLGRGEVGFPRGSPDFQSLVDPRNWGA